MVGVFSVSSTKKVQFSQGNLRYNTLNSQWSFAEYQYSFVGGSSQPSSENVIDLFGWATGSSSAGNNYAANTSSNADDYSNERNIYGVLGYDWSRNSISGVTGRSWSLLSPTEWVYLLYSRSTSTRWTLAKVVDVRGLMIFPDNYVHPLPAPLQNLNSITDGDYWGGRQNFSLSEWSQMQTAGAVFMPQAGDRADGESVTNSQTGCYWTGTGFKRLFFNTSSVGVQSDDIRRRTGCSVRPVTIVQ